MARPALTDEQVLDKIFKGGPTPKHMPHAGGCWVWTGGVQRSNGGLYGRFSRDRKAIRAWWWTWERANGPVPEGMTLDHLCRNTLCVNPVHLEPVTMRVNILRGTNTAAEHARKTHCVNGHPLEGDNLFIAKNGQRMCRTCRRQWERERKARLKASRPDRSNGAKTHCKRGHKFNKANTYFAQDGSRHCRECGAMRAPVDWIRR